MAYVTEMIQTFTVLELEFLFSFVQARLSRNFHHQNTHHQQNEAEETVKEEKDCTLNCTVNGIEELKLSENKNKPSEKKKPTTSQKKKSVKWSDIVCTPPVSTTSSFKSSPYPAKVETPDFTLEEDTDKSQTTKKDGKKMIERKTPISKPRKSEYTGQQWIGFCGVTDCKCVYTFRDNMKSDTNQVENDTVRLDSGRIYDNQLYVRGWEPDFVKWENVRERIYEELKEYQSHIIQVYVDAKGYAFLTFSTHELATKAQYILLSIVSFFGNQLLVNFATTRK